MGKVFVNAPSGQMVQVDAEGNPSIDHNQVRRESAGPHRASKREFAGGIAGGVAGGLLGASKQTDNFADFLQNVIASGSQFSNMGAGLGRGLTSQVRQKRLNAHEAERQRLLDEYVRATMPRYDPNTNERIKRGAGQAIREGLSARKPFFMGPMNTTGRRELAPNDPFGSAETGPYIPHSIERQRIEDAENAKEAAEQELYDAAYRNVRRQKHASEIRSEMGEEEEETDREDAAMEVYNPPSMPELPTAGVEGYGIPVGGDSGQALPSNISNKRNNETILPTNQMQPQPVQPPPVLTPPPPPQTEGQRPDFPLGP